MHKQVMPDPEVFWVVMVVVIVLILATHALAEWQNRREERWRRK